MRNLYKALRMGMVFATALLLLVVAAGAVQAQSLLTPSYVYYRPGTTVPYYNYWLPRTDFCFAPIGMPGVRGDFITSTRFSLRQDAGPVSLRLRFLEDIKAGATAKHKAVW